ncbi:MAG: hypothetical protein ACRCX2_38065 [Paraclostridium sp.]
MIESITEFDELVHEWLEYKIDYEGESMDPKHAIEAIKVGEWSEYCPSMKQELKDRIPEKYRQSLSGKTKFLCSDCITFRKAEINYIIDTFGKENLPNVFDDINEEGCYGCWSFNYYYVLAHIINNDFFWRVKDGV